MQEKVLFQSTSIKKPPHRGKKGNHRSRQIKNMYQEYNDKNLTQNSLNNKSNKLHFSGY